MFTRKLVIPISGKQYSRQFSSKLSFFILPLKWFAKICMNEKVSIIINRTAYIRVKHQHVLHMLIQNCYIFYESIIAIDQNI